MGDTIFLSAAHQGTCQPTGGDVESDGLVAHVFLPQPAPCCVPDTMPGMEVGGGEGWRGECTTSHNLYL